jgi:predicted  nucleic acid-binding Zn ribbon protein
MLTKLLFRVGSDSEFQIETLTGDDRHALTDAADGYVGTLAKYGHISDGYAGGWCGGAWCYYVEATRPDAVDPQHHGKQTACYYAEAVEKFGAAPQVETLEDPSDQTFAGWEDATSLYLFTSVFANKAAATCGDSGESIPSYLLPVSVEAQEGLYFWLNEYQAMDRLWISSGELEMSTCKQMADPTSGLSTRGRELCAEVEAATGKPTYYYLIRYYGRANDATRPCPSCGGVWHQRETEAASEPFHNFHFRCEKCRLVSSVSSSVEENEEHAEIGEFSG